MNELRKEKGVDCILCKQIDDAICHMIFYEKTIFELEEKKYT